MSISPRLLGHQDSIDRLLSSHEEQELVAVRRTVHFPSYDSRPRFGMLPPELRQRPVSSIKETGIVTLGRLTMGDVGVYFAQLEPHPTRRRVANNFGRPIAYDSDYGDPGNVDARKYDALLASFDTEGTMALLARTPEVGASLEPLSDVVTSYSRLYANDPERFFFGAIASLTDNKPTKSIKPVDPQELSHIQDLFAPVA